MISSNVRQQLVDEPTHQSSRGVDSSYELRDHLGGKETDMLKILKFSQYEFTLGGGGEGCTKETLLW